MPSSSLSAVTRLFGVVRRRWYLVLGAAGGLVLATIAFLFIGKVPIPSPPQSTQVLASDGQVIASLHGVEDRTLVPLTKISPSLRAAVVATEDRSFYQHKGVSARGIARALFTNVKEGGVHQGGSTLTQQYVRNAFESVGRKRSIFRKLREAAMAIKVERSNSKDKILELYLNTVYFGRGAYGAEAASRAYFGKHAGELSLSEAAYVAGVIRSPEHLQPERPDAAMAVRDEVLGDMVRNGDTTQAEADAARAQKLAFSPSPAGGPTTARAAFFVEYVRRQLRSEFKLTDAQILGGGLRIHTTLDLKAQKAADTAVADTLDRADDPEVALVAMDTKGQIRAMIGGRDFGNLERARGFNYAYQGSGESGGRQAGSAFKPMTLATFVEEGFSVRSFFPAPSSIRIDSRQCRDGKGDAWSVSNFDRDGYGDLDVTSATERSVNTVYAQMIDRLTPETVAQQAEKIGGWDSIPAVCSVALGSPSVTPLEMARAFATFAGRGQRPDPIAVTKIVDAEGHVVAQRSPRTVNVLEPNVADTVNQVLRGTLTDGTARGKGIGRPAAGKTGTTQNHVDAWFVGYTPTLSTAVWMGFPPDETGKVPEMTRVRGRRVTGGSFPATIWQHFMRDALKGTKSEDFVKPDIGGKVIGERPTPTPEPSPSCGEAFGFPIGCVEPEPSPKLSPSPQRPPPLLPLPTLIPGLPGLDDLFGRQPPSPRRPRVPAGSPSPSPIRLPEAPGPGFPF
jgi:membrane peptidoglycan carboxypeptidase